MIAFDHYHIFYIQDQSLGDGPKKRNIFLELYENFESIAFIFEFLEDVVDENN